MLIVSIVVALKSDSDDVAVPRRFDPPLLAVTRKPTGDRPAPPASPVRQPGSPTVNDLAPQAAPAGRAWEAVELFYCDFGPDWDHNFDNWPDHWTRERSVHYPHYLPIRIVEDASPAAPRSLRIDLNGGAAALHCPPIKVDAMYAYVVEGNVQTRGLEHDEACIALTFLDANGKPLNTVRSQPLRSTTGWTKVRIGPIPPANKDVRSALVTLRLGPVEREDLRGSAWFADVWLGRLPRMIAPKPSGDR